MLCISFTRPSRLKELFPPNLCLRPTKLKDSSLSANTERQSSYASSEKDSG